MIVKLLRLDHLAIKSTTIAMLGLVAVAEHRVLFEHTFRQLRHGTRARVLALTAGSYVTFARICHGLLHDDRLGRAGLIGPCQRRYADPVHALSGRMAVNIGLLSKAESMHPVALFLLGSRLLAAEHHRGARPIAIPPKRCRSGGAAMSNSISRRGFIGGAFGLSALKPSLGLTQGLPQPSAPVALNIIDVAGNLQLTQAGIDRFRQQNPQLVSRMTFLRAPSPELPAKLKAQQDANRVDIDLVLTGPGAMSDGVQQGLWIDVWSKYPTVLPKPEEVYHPQALMMQRNFGKDQGVAVVYSPSGPLFEYNPQKVKTRPRTAAELLAWAKSNRNRFTYARPANSGPGWTFLMALPYILGDKDPGDPMNGWDKTWAWLKELNQAIDYYPGNTSATMKELAEGTRDMIVTTCGWDINPRALGVVPKEMEVFAIEGSHWVPDTQFMCIPKGVSG